MRHTVVGNWTTRGYANSRIANSRTGHLADWSTRVLDKSRIGQLADAISDFACLFFLFGFICETASCPVRELTSPRVGSPRVGVSASCPVTSPSIRTDYYIMINPITMVLLRLPQYYRRPSPHTALCLLLVDSHTHTSFVVFFTCTCVSVCRTW